MMGLNKPSGKPPELVVHWQCAVLPPGLGEPATLPGSPYVQMWRWQHSKDALSPEHLQSLLLPRLTALPPRGAMRSSRQCPPSHAHVPVSPGAQRERHVLDALFMMDKQGIRCKIRSASRNHRCRHPWGAGLCLPKCRCQNTSASPSLEEQGTAKLPSWDARGYWGSPAVLLPNEVAAGQGRIQDSKDGSFPPFPVPWRGPSAPGRPHRHPGGWCRWLGAWTPVDGSRASG